MTKHLSFWLGVFTAALLTVPIAAGIMGASEQELRRIAVIVFVFVAGLVVALVIALFFRDWILRRLFGRAEATLDDVSASLIAGVSAASAGDRDAATAHAQDFVQRGLGWYAWTNFYRWVIATAVALLLAFGAFMGTVLLFEQNQKLGEQTEVLRVQTERLSEQTGFMQAQTELMEAQTERLQEQTEAAAMQNEIMTLNLVNEIREQMLVTMRSGSAVALLLQDGYRRADEGLVTTRDRQCALDFNTDHVLQTPPSETTLRVLEDLAQNAVIGHRVRDALTFLSGDQNGGVAFGATMVLDRLGALDVTHDASFTSVFLLPQTFYEFSAVRSFHFTNAFVDGLSCYPEACEVNAYGSFVRHRALHDARGQRNVMVTRSKGTNRSKLFVSAGSADAVMEGEDVPPGLGPFEDAALIRSTLDSQMAGWGMLDGLEVFLKQTSVGDCATLGQLGLAENLFVFRR